MNCRSKVNGRRGRDASARTQVIDIGDYRVSADPCGSDCLDDAEACRKAVTRAYRELRARGLGDRDAFDAGVRLYRIRHPEALWPEARDLVADWIADALGQ